MAANELSGGMIWEWGERGSGARLVRIENAWREGEGGGMVSSGQRACVPGLLARL